MLKRQRVLLALLKRAERPLHRVELVKWSFVLRHETGSAGGAAFYDFFPFKRGPYSFTLRREMDALVNAGHASSQGDEWTADESPEIPDPVARDVEAVTTRFRHVSVDDLLRGVYSRHPGFTMMSDWEPLAERPTACPAVYTVGYESQQVDAFLDRLIRSGMSRLIDVRHNPTARRYGFHRSTLANLCGQVGIEYTHMPELGIPSAKRVGLDVELNRNDLFRWYESERLRESDDSVRHVADLVTEKPSVLVCLEADPCDCHRNRLANRLTALTGLPTVHLA